MSVSRHYWIGSLLITCSGIFAGPALGQGSVVLFEYDALGRLTTSSDDVRTDVTYSYDAAGNRQAVAGGSPPPPPPPPPPPNQPPVALNQHFFSEPDQTWVIHTSQTASDPDGDALLFTHVTAGATISGGGQYLTIVARPFPAGIVAVTYTVSDPHGATDSAWLQIQTEGLPSDLGP